jgi:phosphoribosylamine-glycine ligase
MSKKVLLIGLKLGTRGSKRYISSALEAGFTIDVLTPKRDIEPSFDHYFRNVYAVNDIFDWNEVQNVSFADDYDGIITRFEEYTVLSAVIAQHLNLTYTKPEDMLAARSKWAMKQRFMEKNVPCAQGKIVTTSEEAKAFAEQYSYPVILKQTSGANSRLVRKAKNEEELVTSFNLIQQNLEKGTSLQDYSWETETNDENAIIVEQMLKGKELTIDTFISDGQYMHTPICHYVMAHELGIDDTSLPIRIMPTHLLNETTAQKAKTITEQALAALGLNRGVAHTELFIDGEDIFVVEIAARGGGMRGQMVEYCCDFDYELATFQTAAGELGTDEVTASRSCACFDFFSQKRGKLLSFDDQTMKNLPNHIFSSIRVEEGTQVAPAKDGGKSLGKLIIGISNDESGHQEAIKTYKQVIEELKVIED